MQRRPDAISEAFQVCRWVNLGEALHHFATYPGNTQGQQHIKPLHWYVACRLVVEGGFHPDDITPRPPFVARQQGGRWLLMFDPSVAGGGERTILGGLKTKNVDVVVTKEGLGPVLATSLKGMTGAFRNLTNRMEETIGECTNLHITYPALVFGYLMVLRANREVEALVEDLPTEDTSPARALKDNDFAIRRGGSTVESIIRFHAALREITGRQGIRDELSRYESVALALVEAGGPQAGDRVADFPAPGDRVHLDRFFETLYLRYEERFVFGAPELKAVTRRLVWAPESPAFAADLFGTPAGPELDYPVRLDAS